MSCSPEPCNVYVNCVMIAMAKWQRHRIVFPACLDLVLMCLSPHSECIASSEALWSFVSQSAWCLRTHDRMAARHFLAFAYLCRGWPIHGQAALQLNLGLCNRHWKHQGTQIMLMALSPDEDKLFGMHDVVNGLVHGCYCVME